MKKVTFEAGAMFFFGAFLIVLLLSVNFPLYKNGSVWKNCLIGLIFFGASFSRFLEFKSFFDVGKHPIPMFFLGALLAGIPYSLAHGVQDFFLYSAGMGYLIGIIVAGIVTSKQLNKTRLKKNVPIG